LTANATREQVRDFLQEAKDVITKPIGNSWPWVLVRRKKNLDFISELGFNYSDVRDIILSLSVKDYCEGPVDDVTERGEFWIFGKVVEGRVAYMKLKIAGISILKIVRVVSFHEAEESLCYSYKE